MASTSGVAVPIVEERLQRFRMSWEDYLALPDDVFAEWVDGEVVVSPRASNRHGGIVSRVVGMLLDALPDLEVITESGARLPGNRLRGPDVMVLLSEPESTWTEEPPILVVEVLSKSSWSEDMVVKSVEYVRAGVGQYWTVDPEDRTVEVDENVDGFWRMLLRLDVENPVGEVSVGEHVVRLDLDRIVPR